MAIIALQCPKATAVQISNAFEVSLLDTLQTLRLWKEGKIKPDMDMDTYPYKDIFSKELPSIREQKPSPQPKQGRNKIITAYMQVPVDTRVDAIKFCEQHNISIHVLRQPKRFLEHVSNEIRQQVGSVIVRKDKESGRLMVHREL